MWTVTVEPQDKWASFPKQVFEHVTGAEGDGSWFVIHTKDGDDYWFSAAVYARVTVVRECEDWEKWLTTAASLSP